MAIDTQLPKPARPDAPVPLSLLGGELLYTGLVALGEPQAAQALAAALRQCGLQIMVADDLAHAQRLAGQVLPDVVVCDLDAHEQAEPWLLSLLGHGGHAGLAGGASVRHAVGLCADVHAAVSLGERAESAETAGRLSVLAKPVAAAAVVAEVCEALYIAAQSAGEQPVGWATGSARAHPLTPDLMLLAPTERKLFITLAQAAPRLLRRDSIREAVWPGEVVSERVVDQYVKRLRARLTQLGSPLAVTTVRGHGYRLELP
ncbi:MAG: helix-turn-helix domain-containing protein [Rubrivivax sp.]|jgi:DNA-binding response OmpR family regulator|nr:helix-turn-helix domain-containing protein [Rubrivivax sp.]